MLGRVLCVASVAVVAVAMAGCGIGPRGSVSVEPMAITGHAMGGQQPVSGAIITLYAANLQGYGKSSISEMTSSVTTDEHGAFVMTGNYQCNADDLVYLVARQGNPGISGVNNQQIGLMAALGRCGDVSTSANIIMNEVTTVAAAWALSQFMPTYDALSTSSTNVTGLKNAFAMAANLASYERGLSPGDVPAGAVVPSDEINSLANALAACVNSPGGVAPETNPCGTLMLAATPPNGTAPTNTLDAALNIARNPGKNVEAIYDLPGADAPFQPTVSPRPNDWTIAVSFLVNTRSTNNMAIDASGNVLVVAGDGLYTLAPNGAPVSTNLQMAGQDVGVDVYGSTWVTTAANTLQKLYAGGTVPQAFDAHLSGTTVVNGLAMDGFGSAWYTCASCTGIYKMDNLGTYQGFFPSDAGSVHQTNIAIGSNEFVWLGNFDYAHVNIFQTSGAPLNPFSYGCGTCGHPAFIAADGSGGAWITGNNLTHLTPGYTPMNYDTGGGLLSPAAVAVDGGGNVWVVNPSGTSSTPTGSLTELAADGTPLSPDAGYLSTQLATPQSVAVDGSGNVWLRNTGSASMTAFVGLATPTTTPLSAAVAGLSVGKKP